MSRPLVITDCDEVLLHMVRHFRAWLAEHHEVDMDLGGRPFADSMRRRGQSEALSEEEMWKLLGGFFDTEMHKQTAIEGAVNAITTLQRDADVVVLTNLTDARNAARTEQLRGFGIEARVFTNQGPKGGAIKAIVEEFGASKAVFIDDIAQHHHSAAEHVPHIQRLHFCGEPELAPHVPCAHKAGAAHARIDSWEHALPWILSQFDGAEDDN